MLPRLVAVVATCEVPPLAADGPPEGLFDPSRNSPGRA